MWRLVRVNIYQKQMFSKKSSVETRIMAKLIDISARIGAHDVFEEFFIPSVIFGQDKEVDITLTGFFFVKVNPARLIQAEEIFKEARVFVERGEISEKDIQNMKDKGSAPKEVKDDTQLHINDLVEIVDGGISMGKVVDINGEFITVSFFLFGQENKTTVHISGVKKIQN